MSGNAIHHHLNGRSNGQPHSNNGQQSMLHRIGEVMEQEGISVRSVARDFRVSVSTIRAQLNPTCDLSISDLRRWQAKLKVPITDLLVDPDSGLSPKILFRSRLLKAMKTVRSIQEQAGQRQIRILATQLVEQMVHLMPELREVPSWPIVGKRRSIEEQGVAVDRSVPDEFFDME
jgi:transcriptional regulator with XRE-family HTH domain